MLFGDNLDKDWGKVNFFLERGDKRRAVSFLEKMLRKEYSYQSKDKMMLKIGELYAEDGDFMDYDRALFWYGQIKGNALHNIARLRMANINRIMGRSDEAKKLYEYLDEKGYAVAQNVFGILYENGDGFQQDTEKAVYYYKRAIESGSTDAVMNLSAVYRTRPDKWEEARAMLKKIISEGCEEAKEYLQSIYDEMLSTSHRYKNDIETVYSAKCILETLERDGDERAKEYLPKVYENITTQQLQAACRALHGEERYTLRHMSLLEERLDRGDATAYYPSVIACKKRGWIANGKHSVRECLELAAENHDARACFRLGVESKDTQEQKDYYLKAIEYGEEKEKRPVDALKARTKLALIYKKEGNTDEAKRLNLEAAELGYFLGYLRLARIWFDEDFDKGVEYCEKAFSLGQSNSAMELYRQYYKRGEFEKAKEWCEKEPDSEKINKLHTLAELYRDGKGTVRDFKKAAQLFDESLSSGDAKDPGKTKFELGMLLLFCPDKSVRDVFRANTLLRDEEVTDTTEEIINEIEVAVICHEIEVKGTRDGFVAVARRFLNGDILKQSFSDAVICALSAIGHPVLEQIGDVNLAQCDEELDEEFRLARYVEECFCDLKLAAAAYLPLAEKNHLGAMHRLSKVFNSMQSSWDSPFGKESRMWAEKAREAGCPFENNNEPELLAMGLCGDTEALEEFVYGLKRKKTVMKDVLEILFSAVIGMYRQKAQHGNSAAQYRLYCILTDSDLSVADEREAVKWNEKAVKNEYPLALMAAAGEYYEGNHSRSEQMEFALKAREKGIASAGIVIDVFRLEAERKARFEREKIEAQYEAKKWAAIEVARGYSDRLDIEERFKNLFWKDIALTDTEGLFLGITDPVEYWYKSKKRHKKMQDYIDGLLAD